MELLGGYDDFGICSDCGDPLLYDDSFYNHHCLQLFGKNNQADNQSYIYQENDHSINQADNQNNQEAFNYQPTLQTNQPAQSTNYPNQPTSSTNQPYQPTNQLNEPTILFPPLEIIDNQPYQPTNQLNEPTDPRWKLLKFFTTPNLDLLWSYLTHLISHPHHHHHPSPEMPNLVGL